MNNYDNELVLGIDTSNYKTSVALIDKNLSIIGQESTLLEVKKGERGLRQSYALFQHIKNLPLLLNDLFANKNLCGEVIAVSVSDRPRNVEGSYMPVFTAGENFGSSIATVMNISLLKFSHQEGHIAAARQFTELQSGDSFIAYHMSGGTTEILLHDHGQLTIIGGTKDISFGQVLDRVGVALGYTFPAGEHLDRISCSYRGNIIDNCFKKVTVDDGYFNLSGLENQAMKLIKDDCENVLVVRGLFDTILEILEVSMTQLGKKYSIDNFLFAGGVASSDYIRKSLVGKNNVNFAQKMLSGDNAVGTAILGGEKIWR